MSHSPASALLATIASRGIFLKANAGLTAKMSSPAIGRWLSMTIWATAFFEEATKFNSTSSARTPKNLMFFCTTSPRSICLCRKSPTLQLFAFGFYEAAQVYRFGAAMAMCNKLKALAKPLDPQCHLVVVRRWLIPFTQVRLYVVIGLCGGAGGYGLSRHQNWPSWRLQGP